MRWEVLIIRDVGYRCDATKGAGEPLQVWATATWQSGFNLQGLHAPFLGPQQNAAADLLGIPNETVILTTFRAGPGRIVLIWGT